MRPAAKRRGRKPSRIETARWLTRPTVEREEAKASRGRSRRRAARIEKLRNSRHNLRWGERLVQKDAVGDALLAPLLGRSARHIAHRHFGLYLARCASDFPAIKPTKQVDVSNERAIFV